MIYIFISHEINSKKPEKSGASCPAPLENDNYISLYPPNYSHRRD